MVGQHCAGARSQARGEDGLCGGRQTEGQQVRGRPQLLCMRPAAEAFCNNRTEYTGRSGRPTSRGCQCCLNNCTAKCQPWYMTYARVNAVNMTEPMQQDICAVTSGGFAVHATNRSQYTDKKWMHHQTAVILSSSLYCLSAGPAPLPLTCHPASGILDCLHPLKPGPR